VRTPGRELVALWELKYNVRQPHTILPKDVEKMFPFRVQRRQNKGVLSAFELSKIEL
jgi:hypothetical protein